MILVDTHAHLNFNAYKNDVDEVIKISLDNNIWMINVGSQYSTSKRAMKMTKKYKQGVYAAIGLHPIHLETGLIKIKNDTEEIEIKTREEDFDYEKYRELAKSERVVAIGEIGLDYYYKPKTKGKLELFKEKQKKILIEQLNLAKELNLPIIFHCRSAHDDLLNILRFQVSSFKFQGVIHCFTGTWEQAEKYLEMGLYLGFNGLIFKMNFDDIIRKTPIEKILIETDCPYLAPPPFENQRNEPLYLKYIVEKIAQIKNLNYDEIVKITTENARKLFNL
jgi:TatD DNase family protein